MSFTDRRQPWDIYPADDFFLFLPCTGNWFGPKERRAHGKEAEERRTENQDREVEAQKEAVEGVPVLRVLRPPPATAP